MTSPAGEKSLVEVYSAVGGAAFLTGLMDEWVSAGLSVDAVQAVSDAEYRTQRGKFTRLKLRWRMYAGQAWTSFGRARRRSGCEPFRIVTTNPFFSPALVAWSAGKKGRTINLLYDLYPEALVLAGTVRPRSVIARTCSSLTRYALRQCDATVFLGEGLRRYTESEHGPARRAVVIPVGADGRPFRAAPPKPSVGPIKLLYSGNLGRMHDTGTFRAIWERPAITNLSWTFHAAGPGYEILKREMGAAPGIHWGCSLGAKEWENAMRKADVALVSLAPGAEKVVMPSKTYSALVAGQAVLAVCPKNSDLADLITTHDCGWVIEPGDTVALHRLLTRIVSDRQELDRKRQNAFQAGHQHFDTTVVARQWRQLFADLE